MDLSQILNGAPQQPQPQQQSAAVPQAMQGLGLGASMNPVPDFQAPVPATPQEREQRKSAWATVLNKINSDPNLQRAMLVTGLSMMRPGANLGSSGLAGLSAYEAGRQADDQRQTQQRREGREDEVHQERMQSSKDQREWNAQVKPLELQKLQAQIDALPNQAERDKLDLEVAKIQAENAPEMARLGIQRLEAQIRATDRQGQAALRETDVQRTAGAIEQQLLSDGLDPISAKAQAYERAMGMRQTAAGAVKMTALDEADLKNFLASQNSDKESIGGMLLELDPDYKSSVDRGRLIAERQGLTLPQNPPPSTQPAVQGTSQAQEPVYDLDTIRRQLQQKKVLEERSAVQSQGRQNIQQYQPWGQ